MDRKTGIIIAAIVAAFVGLVAVSTTQKVSYDYNKYDLNSIIEPDEASGGLGDMVKGPKDAKVLLVEYGNYQCTACAPMNPKINALLEEYKDKSVALVFRSMSLPDHPNATAAAAAALAAAKQGYWAEYKDYIYANQDDWFYSDSAARTQQFEEYFLKVSGMKGDVEQFRRDMKSDEVARKILFDEKLATRANAQWSPYFLLNGNLVSQQGMTADQFIEKLRGEIDKALKE